MNMYVYADNNPLSFVDPYGLDPIVLSIPEVGGTIMGSACVGSPEACEAVGEACESTGQAAAGLMLKSFLWQLGVLNDIMRAEGSCESEAGADELSGTAADPNSGGDDDDGPGRGSNDPAATRAEVDTIAKHKEYRQQGTQNGGGRTCLMRIVIHMYYGVRD